MKVLNFPTKFLNFRFLSNFVNPQQIQCKMLKHSIFTENIIGDYKEDYCLKIIL